MMIIIIIIIIIIISSSSSSSSSSIPCHNWSLNLFYENMIQRLRVRIWHLSIILVLNINIIVFEILGLFLSSGRNDVKRVTFCSAARYMCCRIQEWLPRAPEDTVRIPSYPCNLKSEVDCISKMLCCFYKKFG